MLEQQAGSRTRIEGLGRGGDGKVTTMTICVVVCHISLSKNLTILLAGILKIHVVSKFAIVEVAQKEVMWE